MDSEAASTSNSTTIMDVEQELTFDRAHLVSTSKRTVLGIMIDPIDYRTAVARTIDSAKQQKPFTVSALAVHGTMTGVIDPEQRFRLNRFDLLVPDGQPVRWALNLLHRTRLVDRVYGPKLTLMLLDRAAQERIPVFLYGTTNEILSILKKRLHELFPTLTVAGSKQSAFRQLSQYEKAEVVEEIRASGARMVFAALGCPRQEVWAYEHRELLSMPIIAIGAAFPFIAGTLAQAPSLMQDTGLEWLYRLIREPKRLWRRYVLLNPLYALLIALQLLGKHFDQNGLRPEKDVSFG